VHNAGVMPPGRTETPQGHELAFATHILGPHLMTERFAAAAAPGRRRPRGVRLVGRACTRTGSGWTIPSISPAASPDRLRTHGQTDAGRPSRAVGRRAGHRARRGPQHAPGWADTPGSRIPCPGSGV
jgi:hypothetical protein